MTERSPEHANRHTIPVLIESVTRSPAIAIRSSAAPILSELRRSALDY